MILSRSLRVLGRALATSALCLAFASAGNGACAQSKPAKPAPPAKAAKKPPALSSQRLAPLAIGIGVGAPLDFERDVTFADAVKVGRQIEPAAGVSADENGWLKGDGSILVWASGPGNNTAGTYKLKYAGRAKVTVELADAKIGEETYDEKSDTSTRDVRLDKDQDTFKLRFENTTRGVRDVKLMRPVQKGASTAHGVDEVWYRPMKQIQKRFSWIRTMDFTATNGQNVVQWKDRTKPGRWSQQNAAEGTWWQGRGAAWEYVVNMANDAQKDLWICVPLLADDEYVKNLANLLKYGSDGVNPYKSSQKNPVWAPLAPNLKLYVEYSNEVWNFGFPQWTQLLEKSRAEVKAGNTNLNFDGSTFDGDWNIRYWVRRIAQISDIFRATFGNDQMHTRIRPLFETQLGWADNYLWHGLWFLDAWFDNGDGKEHVKTPHPVHYYVWGTGGSTYPIGFSEELDQSKTLNVDQMFKGYREMFDKWIEHQKRDIDFARAFGLHRVSYEGGTGMDDKSGDEWKGTNLAKQRAQRDPRITSIYGDMLKRYAALGGEGFTNFLTTHPQHGVVSDYDGSGLESPKTRAIAEALAQKPSLPTWGITLPATISAGRYRVARKGGVIDKDEAVEITPDAWYGYTVRNEARETLSVRVSASSPDDQGRLNVWVDGELAGTLTIKNSGGMDKWADSSTLSITLEPGQHGIRLDGAAGKFNVNSLILQR